MINFSKEEIKTIRMCAVDVKIKLKSMSKLGNILQRSSAIKKLEDVENLIDKIEEHS